MKKKVFAVVCAAILALSIGLIGCSGGSSSSSSTKYADGTYTGTGQGKGGTITVTLTIANDVITVDSIDGADHETTGVGGKEAIEDGTFKSQIEAAQSADIDGVSGATLTSTGVKDAVTDCLNQAAAAK